MMDLKFIKGFFYIVSVILVFAGADVLGAHHEPKTLRPNILWISIEDTSPDFGCYGDEYAITPNVDRLASEGVTYTRAFSHSGVCAVARSGIITGMYPSSIGTNNMRCKGVPPAGTRCFPEYLRAAGYYCTNNNKTDYQFDVPENAWDENGSGAHWKKRKKGQAFFSVFNFKKSHESKTRAPYNSLIHNPDEAPVPPYHPDTPVVRRDWARYYDTVTQVDKDVGSVLKELEDAGLAENTIVWFWGDHGRGLPRCKRWLYDSGIHVPLIIRVPEKFREHAYPKDPDQMLPGSVNDSLVSFIDFAPTMLNLAGIKLPSNFHGQPFLGPDIPKHRKYIYGARDRMDEAYDCIRIVRGKRYKYFRNFMAHVSYGHDIGYMNRMPTMIEMRKLNAEGKLKGGATQYFRETKPVEELFDTKNDPHELNNLANSPKHQELLREMRRELYRWMRETVDMGLMPEPDYEDIKYPNGVQSVVRKPEFVKVDEGDGDLGMATIGIVCATKGASISFARTGGKYGFAWPPKWNVFTSPISVGPGEGLWAKAGRIGFEESGIASYANGQHVPFAGTVRSNYDGYEWKDDSTWRLLLERILAVKALDDTGASGIPAYLEALEDESPAVRYWATVGLQHTCKEPAEIGAAKAALYPLLKDASYSVRCSTAEAFCRFGKVDIGLPVLLDAAKSDHVRGSLFAISAMYRLGDGVRPATAFLHQQYLTGDEYTFRLSRHVLEKLGETVPYDRSR